MRAFAGRRRSWASCIGAAPKPGTVEDHGAFSLPNDGKAPAEFLMLLDVGCKRPQVTIASTGSVRTVTVGGQSITLN